MYGRKYDIRCNQDFVRAEDAMDYLKSEFMKGEPSMLLVKGGPGTRKTTFLCQSALSFTEKVVCIVNDEMAERFRKELAEEKRRQNLGEEHGQNIVVVGVFDETESISEPVETGTVVIVDMLNFISADLFLTFYKKNPIVASFDINQGDDKYPVCTALNWLRHNQKPDKKMLYLANSNRQEFFLEWTKKYLYNNRINGSPTTRKAWTQFHNCGEKEDDAKEKIVEVVKMLRSRDPEGTIGISFDNEAQIKSIKEVVLPSAGLSTDPNIQVARIKEWGLKSQVKHFIFIQHLYGNILPSSKQPKYVSIGMTRPMESFHLVGNLEKLKTVRYNWFTDFLQWADGEPRRPVPRAPEADVASRVDRDASIRGAPAPEAEPSSTPATRDQVAVASGAALEAKEPPKEPESRFLRRLGQVSIPEASMAQVAPSSAPEGSQPSTAAPDVPSAPQAQAAPGAAPEAGHSSLPASRASRAAPEG